MLCAIGTRAASCNWVRPACSRAAINRFPYSDAITAAYGISISSSRLRPDRLFDILRRMLPISWPSIIRALIDSGLTQPEIARLCACGQSTISDLLRGETIDPRTSTGLLLLGLARSRRVFDPFWPHPEGAA